MVPLIKILLLFLLTYTTLSAQPSGSGIYVIVHGAFGGAWAFKKVDSLLTARGYKVYRATLTGLGERAHLSSPEIGLSVHIQDVVNLFLYENLQDVTLIGHSYGGMVITGVADSVPGRIRKMIYLDALLPEDGESLSSARLGHTNRKPYEIRDGLIIPPWVTPEMSLPHDLPQPAKTFTEPIRLKNKNRSPLPSVYIHTVEKGKKAEEDDFWWFAERASKRGVKVVRMEADHNPHWSKPFELTELLEQNK